MKAGLRRARCIGLSLALIAATTAGAFATEGTAALTQLFPELSRAAEAQRLELSIGWWGLSRCSPLEATYTLDRRGNQYVGTWRVRIANKRTMVRPVSLPRDIVRAFLRSVSGADVMEKEYAPRTTHTDDYPSVRLAVMIGNEKLEIETTSQPQPRPSASYSDRSPWAIHYSGRALVTDSDLDKTYEPLLAALVQLRIRNQRMFSREDRVCAFPR
jgi:hypothetical protein